MLCCWAKMDFRGPMVCVYVGNGGKTISNKLCKKMNYKEGKNLMKRPINISIVRELFTTKYKRVCFMHRAVFYYA